MNVKINGDDVELTAEMSVSELLLERNVKMPDMVSVELNGAIVDRADFAATVVRDGDAVEFLYFMGGGASRRD